MRPRVLWLIAATLAACESAGSSREVGSATTGEMPTGGATSATTGGTPSSSTSTGGGSEGATPQSSSEAGSGSSSTGPALCNLGQPDHCGECDLACPGLDGKTAVRLCVDEACDLHCLAEFYDVNGSPHDGCEAQDLPVQDSVEAAVEIDLPDVDDPTFMSNPLDHVAAIYGDERVHDDPLTDRPLGREDRYAITATGAGVGGGMMACLGITNFPADNLFEVCLGDPGDDELAAASCATVTGGAGSECVTPPSGGDAGGPYPLRVRKLAGTNTENGYALFLQH